MVCTNIYRMSPDERERRRKKNQFPLNERSKMLCRFFCCQFILCVDWKWPNELSEANASHMCKTLPTFSIDTQLQVIHTVQFVLRIQMRYFFSSSLTSTVAAFGQHIYIYGENFPLQSNRQYFPVSKFPFLVISLNHWCQSQSHSFIIYVFIHKYIFFQFTSVQTTQIQLLQINTNK